MRTQDIHGRFPKRTQGQANGSAGELLAVEQLIKAGCICHSYEDVGVDIFAEIGTVAAADGSVYPTGEYPFGVQVKTPDKMRFRFKVTTLNHWANCPFPILLFLIHGPTGTVYAKSLSEIGEICEGQKTKTITFDENDEWGKKRERPGGQMLTKAEALFQAVRAFHTNTNAISPYEAKRRAEARKRWRSNANNVVRLCDFVWDLYGGVAEHHDGLSLLTAGRQYAVRYPLLVTELAHELLRPEAESVENLLGPKLHRSAGARERSIKAGTLTPFILGTGLLREVAITNANPARLFNGLTFTLDRAEWDRNTRKLACLKFACGRYFDMLETCDCMETELLDFLVREETTRAAKASNDTILRHLDLRRRYHDLFLRLHPEHKGEPGALLFDGDGRSAAVAIATMVVFEHDDDMCFFLGKRSDLGVAIQAGLTHLIPGGQFQPEWTANNVYQILIKHDGHVADEDPEFEGAIRREFSITEHVLRESVEELFNFNPTTEPQFQPGTHDPQWYKATKPGEELVRMMEDGRAELAVTGVVWNPLNTRAEICTILRIKDPHWFKRNDDNDLLRINEEWEPAKQTTQSRKNDAWFVRLGEFRSRIDTLDYEDYLLSPEHEYRNFISPEHIVPVGAGAFWLGIRWLREHPAGS